MMLIGTVLQKMILLKESKTEGVKGFLKNKNETKEIFYQIRGEQETFRAIYRLSVIGVIDDYKVDYN